jgi:hypothetical protein
MSNAIVRLVPAIMRVICTPAQPVARELSAIVSRSKSPVVTRKPDAHLIRVVEDYACRVASSLIQ